MRIQLYGVDQSEPVAYPYKEVKRQFDTIPGLLDGTPGHGKAVQVDTSG